MNIYKITNNLNGKIYIGKDTTDDENYYGSGLLIRRAIEKYGKENFTKEIIEELDNYDELSIREIYWIDHYNSTNLEIGYNISNGGDGGDTISNHPDRDLICEKISKGSPKRGMTYEEAFGEEYAKEYKRKLSESHPRLSMKELTGDYYETWLENVRKVAKSKKGKSIKENNNWTEEQYQEYLKNLSKRSKKSWSKISEEDKKRIKNLNKERAFQRRIDNINDFIEKFNNGEITKDNYRAYSKKIWHWKKDLGDDLKEYLSDDILKSYYKMCEMYSKENIKIGRQKRKNNFKHTKESKNKIIESRKKKFTKYFEPIKENIDNLDLKDLEDYYSLEESKRIRKKLLNSKFRYLIEDYIDIIKKTIPKKEKVIKPISKNYYGNTAKKVNIEGIIYESISDAAKSLNMNKASLRYRLKSDSFKNYFYI